MKTDDYKKLNRDLAEVRRMLTSLLETIEISTTNEKVRELLL